MLYFLDKKLPTSRNASSSSYLFNNDDSGSEEDEEDEEEEVLNQTLLKFNHFSELT